MNNEEDWKLLQRNTAEYWGRKQNGSRFGEVVTFCAIFVYFISIPRSKIVSIRSL